MRVSGRWGAGILVALLMGLATASSAFAHELPEWGRCVKAATGTQGEFTSATCLTKTKAPKAVTYNWVAPSQSELLTFAGGGTETTLRTVGHSTIKCAAVNMTGEYTGAKTASVTMEFQACADQAGNLCKSPQVTATGEILSFPMAAELGFTRHEEVNGKLVVAVGMDLKPTPPLTSLASYECTGSGETANVEGSVIAKLKPFDKMTSEINPAFFVRKTGQQVPESFQGGPKDTLSTTYTKGVENLGTFDSTLNVLEGKGTNSTPMEIKALEK